MTRNDIRAINVEQLLKVAPDLSADNIGDHDHLQDDPLIHQKKQMILDKVPSS
ncbi:hypothetical protein ACVDG3_20240 [Meridianimarinicoccus sp. RP-17]|uniref:hypothetical protein n=1 Tax=Meridianimarinicoccus zhengii TaxID=2056810 RepID=UPI0013A6F533|nr:hypothetical protein [Phycocomes zhengii]